MSRVPSVLRRASPATHEQSFGVKKRTSRIHGRLLSALVKNIGSSVRSVIMYSTYNSATFHVVISGVRTVLETNCAKMTPVMFVLTRVSPVTHEQSFGVKKRTV
jgi:hypothetical protein